LSFKYLSKTNYSIVIKYELNFSINSKLKTPNSIMSDCSEEMKQADTDIFTANDPENGDSMPPAEIFEKAKIAPADNVVVAPTQLKTVKLDTDDNENHSYYKHNDSFDSIEFLSKNVTSNLGFQSSDDEDAANKLAMVKKINSIHIDEKGKVASPKQRPQILPMVLLCEAFAFLEFANLYGKAAKLSKKIREALVNTYVVSHNREIKFVFDHHKCFDIDDLEYVIRLVKYIKLSFCNF